MGPKVGYLGRRFHAWWEGHGFDPALERRAVLLGSRGVGSLNDVQDQTSFIGEALWGPGRLGPGSPSWTMLLARTLMIDEKAKVGVFGAERGGVLYDLQSGTNWHVSGYSHYAVSMPQIRLNNYNRMNKRRHKPSLDGAMMLFEMYREPEPKTQLDILAQMLLPGGKAVLVDFTSLRRDVRLKHAFAGHWNGILRHSSDYEALAKQSGLSITNIVDVTPQYLPLISQGWASWRYAWQILSDIPDNRQRLHMLNLITEYASIWAERYDAMRSGQLLVSRLMVEKLR